VVRINFGWNEVSGDGCATQTLTQLRDPNNTCYNWTLFDSLVSQATARGIQVLASVSRTPRWVLGNTNPNYVGTRSSEWTRLVTNYESFMGAAAQRYAAGSTYGTIKLWTVWNEPNSTYHFAPITTSIMRSAMPKRYAQMVGKTAVAIKTANPTALVSLGPTGPQSTIKPIPYILAVQKVLPTFLPGSSITAKRHWVDAWSHNPYPGVTISPSRGKATSPTVGMSNIRDLFTQLDAAPITKGMKVWATEFAYQTNPPDKTLGISPALQGRFMAESFDWLESTNRVTVLIWYGFTDAVDLADWQSGTYYSNGVAKPSLAWFQRPVSVPLAIVRRGTTARVWARSNVNPSATRIAFSYDNKTWKLLPIMGRKSDGTTIINVRVMKTIYFATWDGVRGPARPVLAR